MGPNVPESSGEALMAQHRSSSLASSEPSSPLAPSYPIAHPSSPENNGSQPKRRKKRQNNHTQRKHTIDEIIACSSDEEKGKQVTPNTSRRDSVGLQKKEEEEGCHDSCCCEYAAGFTADCAAVCCCPLALLHLAALTFIRLPTAVAWKTLVNIKDKIIRKRWQHRQDIGKEDSVASKDSNRWSYEDSPEGTSESNVRLNSQYLWKQFEGSNLDFGGLSMRRDPF